MLLRSITVCLVLLGLSSVAYGQIDEQEAAVARLAKAVEDGICPKPPAKVRLLEYKENCGEKCTGSECDAASRCGNRVQARNDIIREYNKFVDECERRRGNTASLPTVTLPRMGSALPTPPPKPTQGAVQSPQPIPATPQEAEQPSKPPPARRPGDSSVLADNRKYMVSVALSYCPGSTQAFDAERCNHRFEAFSSTKGGEYWRARKEDYLTACYRLAFQTKKFCSENAPTADRTQLESRIGDFAERWREFTRIEHSIFASIPEEKRTTSEDVRRASENLTKAQDDLDKIAKRIEELAKQVDETKGGRPGVNTSPAEPKSKPVAALSRIEKLRNFCRGELRPKGHKWACCPDAIDRMVPGQQDIDMSGESYCEAPRR